MTITSKRRLDILKAAGLGVSIAAVIMMVDDSAAQSLEAKERISGVQNGAIIVLVVSLVVVAVSATGCYGALKNKPKPLFAFFVLMLILPVMIDVTLICVMSWFVFAKHHVVAMMDTVLDRNLQDFMQQNETHARIFMINIQSVLECCGFRGIRDYMTDKQRETCLAPDSLKEKQYYIRGCRVSMAAIFAENIAVIVTTECGHLILCILSMVSAWKLRKRILAQACRYSAEPARSTSKVAPVRPAENRVYLHMEEMQGQKRY